MHTANKDFLLRVTGIGLKFFALLLIIKIDKNIVDSIESLLKVLESKNEAVLIQGVYPNGREAYYGVNLK